MQHHLPGRVDARGHVSQAEGHGLVLHDGLAESLPVARIIARALEGRARHAHRLRGDADATALKVGQRDLVALAFLAQPPRGRDAHVLEGDLAGVGQILSELVLDTHDLVARGVGRDDEAEMPRLPASGSVTANTITVWPLRRT